MLRYVVVYLFDVSICHYLEIMQLQLSMSFQIIHFSQMLHA